MNSPFIQAYIVNDIVVATEGEKVLSDYLLDILSYTARETELHFFLVHKMAHKIDMQQIQLNLQ